MAKKLKFWNGRGVNGNGHIYVAAYSKADACKILTEATGYSKWNYELTTYFSEGCWGNAMDKIVPERGVWQTTNKGGTCIENTPHRIYPKYTESKLKVIPVTDLLTASEKVHQYILEHPTPTFDIPDEIYVPWLNAIKKLGGNV